MREHSNSVFIALFEISLAALIFFILDRAPNDILVRIVTIAAVFFVWLVPNVFLWSQANRLEASLVSGAPAYGTSSHIVEDVNQLVAQGAPKS